MVERDEIDRAIRTAVTVFWVWSGVCLGVGLVVGGLVW